MKEQIVGFMAMYPEYFALLVGGIFVLLAMRQYAKVQTLMNSGIKTQATLIDHKKVEKRKISHSSSGMSVEYSKMYYPVYEYEHMQAGVKTFLGSTGSSWKTGAIGKKINIYYDPRDEDNVITDTFFGKYGTVFILALVSVMFGLGTFFALKNMNTEIVRDVNTTEVVEVLK